MSKDLRQFLQVVREAGPQYYAEVKKPLDPVYEVGVIQQKLAKEGRFPVIYCPQIEGSKLPLVTDLFGSYELLGLALDFTPERVKAEGKAGILQEYGRRRKNSFPPKEVAASEAPVQQVVLKGKDADLGLLPITKHAEGDSDKYATIGYTITKDPDTGIPNVGVYRQELKGKDRIACHMAPTHHGAHIARRHAELGKPLEVVTIFGHHPAVGIGAAVTGPPEMNEMEIMGSLLGEPLEITPGVTVNLPIMARAEIAVEGVIDPTKMETEGPFGEFYGYYGDPHPCYVMQVKAITMRQDAIYHDLYSGHQEHAMAGLLNREHAMYGRLKAIVNNLIALHYGPEGQCGQALMYVSIKKRSQGDGRQAGLAALCAEPAVKMVVVVDEDVDVYDESEVLWAMATRVRADMGVVTIPRMPTYWLNPTAHDETGINRGTLDGKVIIDATEPSVLPFAKRITLPKELWDSIKLEDYLK